MTVPVLILVSIATVLLIYIGWRVTQLGGGQITTQIANAASKSEAAVRDEFARSRIEAGEASRTLREEIGGRFGQMSEGLQATLANTAAAQQTALETFQGVLKQLSELLSTTLQQASASQGERLDAFGKNQGELNAAQALAWKQFSDGQGERLLQVSNTLAELTRQNAEQQQALRDGVAAQMEALRTENAAKLEQMRVTVDEKLQGTLNERLGASFKLVSDQLEQVYKSVGEMQTLATGVGDLKRVLSNVKMRGTWGEVTLESVLEQFLTPDQFARNVEVRPGSAQRVEFAIRLPAGEDDRPLWLPIDAKFPIEDYERLVDASDRADVDGVEAAGRALEARVKLAAKNISEKYIAPPHSTDFAILFLPTEGLFAEVIRRPGLVDAIQRECRVVVAGPTTLGAQLGSIRLGFRSLAIQKQSSEVWRVLGAVKTEFGKYGEVLDKVQKKLHEASTQIDQVQVRKRAIDRKLRTVEELPAADTGILLEIDGEEVLALPAEQ